MERVWKVHPSAKRAQQTVESLRRLLLRQRGVEELDMEAFFVPVYERDIHDPLLLSDMQIAVDRIFHAIKKQERILVYGDYDADGVSSTAILITVLRQLGAQVTPYLPHRGDDGYGLNRRVLESLSSEVDLVLSVDCGVSNVEEVAFLHTKHIDTIVIDHHSIPDQLPDALAIIHPRHPRGAYICPHLCGAGVAWKVAQALLRDKRSGVSDDTDHEKWLLDLAVLGTIADVVPLRGENRAIVRFGLEVLRRTRRPGLRAMLASLRLDIAHLDAEHVAFRIIPRLNAAGRMDHAQPALELLLADNEAKAETLLQQLHAHNLQRQSVSKRVLREAELQVSQSQAPYLLAYDASWPAGVVGLAAGRLADKYGRPAIVVGSSGTEMVGSARSPLSVNIVELLQKGKAHLKKLGGHAQAAGFTVEVNGLEGFRAALDAAGAALAQEVPTLSHEADAVIQPILASQATIDMLRHFAPFGEGNKQPAFIMKDVPLDSWRPVGKEEKHAKCVFTPGDTMLEGIGFSLVEQMKNELKNVKSVDVLGSLSENEFRGRRSVQLEVRDIAPAGKVKIQ